MDKLMPAARIIRKALIGLMLALIRVNSVNPRLSSKGIDKVDICRYNGF
jgi:hypothetical protein